MTSLHLQSTTNHEPARLRTASLHNVAALTPSTITSTPATENYYPRETSPKHISQVCISRSDWLTSQPSHARSHIAQRRRSPPNPNPAATQRTEVHSCQTHTHSSDQQFGDQFKIRYLGRCQSPIYLEYYSKFGVCLFRIL